MSQMYYNIALLNNLSGPIKESLFVLDQQLTDFLNKKTDNSAITAYDGLHLVNGSLLMIDCRALAKIVTTMEDAAKGIAFSDRRGWSPERLLMVAKSLKRLNDQVMSHFRDMVNGKPDWVASLWPAWRDLKEAMLEQVPPPVDLFEPAPRFDQVRFNPLAQHTLKEVADGAIKMFREAASDLLMVAKNPQAADARKKAMMGIQKAQGATDKLYHTFHRRGFHLYFMVLRARLAWAALDGEDNLLLKAKEWAHFLLEVAPQIQKYGEDAKSAPHIALMSLLMPMMKPWPTNWHERHPALAELEIRLSLRDFWELSQRVQQVRPGEEEDDQKVNQEAALKEAFQNIHQAWSRFSTESVPDVRPFLRAISEMLKLNKALPYQAALDLFKQVGLFAKKMSENPDFAYDDAYMQEMAFAILLLEDALEKRGKGLEDFDQQSRIQVRRMEMFMANGAAAINGLATPTWGSETRRRLIADAVQKVLKRGAGDIEEIERILNAALFEDDSSAFSSLPKAEDLCWTGAQVMKLLGFHAAVPPFEALARRIQNLTLKSGQDKKQMTAEATLLVSALSMFHQAAAVGDPLASRHFKSVAHILAQGNGDGDKDFRWMEEVSLNRWDDLPDQSNTQQEAQSESAADVFAQLPEEPAGDASVENVVTVDQELPDDAESVTASLNEPEVVADFNENQTAFSVAQEEPDEQESGIADHADEARSNDRREVLAALMNGAWSDRVTDAEIFESLLAEAASNFETALNARETLQNDVRNQEALEDLRRVFHTMKGGARISGLVGLGELMFMMEERLNEALAVEEAYHLLLDEAVGQAIADAMAVLSEVNWPAEIDGRVLAEKIKLSRHKDEGELINDEPLSAIEFEVEERQELPDIVLPVLEKGSSLSLVNDVDEEALPEIAPIELTPLSQVLIQPSSALMHDIKIDEIPTGQSFSLEPIADQEESHVETVEEERVQEDRYGGHAFEFAPAQEQATNPVAEERDELMEILEKEAKTLSTSLISCLTRSPLLENPRDLEEAHRCAHTLGSLGAQHQWPTIKRLGRLMEALLEISPDGLDNDTAGFIMINAAEDMYQRASDPARWAEKDGSHWEKPLIDLMASQEQANEKEHANNEEVIHATPVDPMVAIVPLIDDLRSLAKRAGDDVVEALSHPAQAEGQGEKLHLKPIKIEDGASSSDNASVDEKEDQAWENVFQAIEAIGTQMNVLADALAFLMEERQRKK